MPEIAGYSPSLLDEPTFADWPSQSFLCSNLEYQGRVILPANAPDGFVLRTLGEPSSRSKDGAHWLYHGGSLPDPNMSILCNFGDYRRLQSMEVSRDWRTLKLTR